MKRFKLERFDFIIFCCNDQAYPALNGCGRSSISVSVK